MTCDVSSRTLNPTHSLTHSEMSLSRQSIALVLTTKNKETKHHIHPKHKKATEKTAPANKTTYILVWYAFYDFQPGHEAGPILTAPEPT